ncbi:hypothetical protein GF322_02840 [Candidatus Dependentiae bacterium]|nr:hypothetical protein [Candidatus Dependentiae bacterium]
MNKIFKFVCFKFFLFAFSYGLGNSDFNDLLSRYYLDAPMPFTYKYETEVAYCSYQNTPNGISEISGSFELPESINIFAKDENKNLNDSIFFNTKFIRNPKLVRNHYLSKDIPVHQQGKIISVKTEDDINLNCTFFDRGSSSKKLLIVGGGFTNEREIMIPFVEIFSQEYDIVLMEYRGHGYNTFDLFNPLSWFESPTKYIFGADLNTVRLGVVEEKDVFAVVNKFKKMKKYDKVIGLGVCYSALIFIKAEVVWQQQHKGERLFKNGIIADGCWLSLQNFVEKIAQDPKRIVVPQYGGWNQNWLVKKPWFKDWITWLGQKLFYTKFNEVSILDYLPKLKNIPLLFFYGKNDLVINRFEFETIWNAAKTLKVAVITSNPHVINHIKQKELYKLICEKFIEMSYSDFINYLK